MIELPDGVVPNGIALRLMDFGGTMRPPLGGPLLRVNRLGNRFAAAVSLPPIPNKDLGRVVVSRLIRAKVEGLRIELPLCGVDQGSPGSPLVNGAGQAGYSLDVDGLTPGYGFSEGYWFSIVSAGQHYLHNVAAAGMADETGAATIEFAPALRVIPENNAVIHLAQPMMEGLVVGDEFAWSYSLAHHVGIEFEIEEAA